MEDNIVCKVCKQPIQISWNFCPNCGNTLRERPLSTSLGKQLLIYSISLFLPPFGLGYALKYLKQDNSKSKAVGIIAILLTLLSIAGMIIAFKNLMDYYSKILNNLGTVNYP